MHLHQVWVRYGLMLEAYCRGCGRYRKELISQVAALHKMQQVRGEKGEMEESFVFPSQVTGELQNLPKRRSDEMLQWLREKDFKAAMENVSSPLDPTLRFRALQ